MFVLGPMIFGAASLMAALAPGYATLTAMRFLEGVGGAIVVPAALGLVRALFPKVTAFGHAMAVGGGVSVTTVGGFLVAGAGSRTKASPQHLPSGEKPSSAGSHIIRPGSSSPPCGSRSGESSGPAIRRRARLFSSASQPSRYRFLSCSPEWAPGSRQAGPRARMSRGSGAFLPTSRSVSACTRRR